MTKLWQVLWSTRENRKDQRWEVNHFKSNIVGVQIGAEMSLSALLALGFWCQMLNQQTHKELVELLFFFHTTLCGMFAFVVCYEKVI